MGSGKRARGYLILRHTLFLACCQDIAKVVMDDDKRTPSIKGLIGELDNHLVRDALRKRYAEVSPTLMDGEPDEELVGLLRAMDEREALERGVMFDRLYADFVGAWVDLSASEAVKGYVTIEIRPQPMRKWLSVMGSIRSSTFPQPELRGVICVGRWRQCRARWSCWGG